MCQDSYCYYLLFNLGLLILLVNCGFVVFFFLQFDNLSAAHETSKLEIEASHSDEVELLKKAYETSLSGKNACFQFK